MAPRAPKTVPRRRARTPDPWLAVVAWLKRQTDDDGYRLKGLAGLSGWQDFTAAWLSQGVPVLSLTYPRSQLYAGPMQLAEVSIWAWNVIEGTGGIDAALEATNEASGLSSVALIRCFDTMRAHMLLYPDGYVRPDVERCVSQEGENPLYAADIRHNGRLIKSIQTTSQLQRLSKKHGGGNGV